MTTLTLDLLRTIMPDAGRAAVAALQPLNDAMVRWGISDPVEQAVFLANVAVETGELQSFTESLNYTPEALLRTWPKHFDEKSAYLYGRGNGHPADQRMIGILAYGGRMGNAPAPSTDGYDYRGRGAIQTTGKVNYQRLSEALGRDFVTRPDLVATPAWAFDAAGFYWTDMRLGPLARSHDLRAVRRAINGWAGDKIAKVESYFNIGCAVLT